jgi:ABC-type sugar transport system ATPase subunit
MSDGPVIEAIDVRKDYGHVSALRGASIAVHRGEIVALVGDNGAGKSTLMKSMCGAVTPDSGEIRILGEHVVFASMRTAHALGVQTVYQDLALAPHLTVPENIFLGVETLREGPLGRFGVLARRRMAADAKESLETLGIPLTSVKVPITSLSGGQRQAVAIARAIRWARTALLMDEPTAALGVAQTEIVVETIRRAAGRGLGVLLISHDMPRMLGLAHRIVVLRHGAVVADMPGDSSTIPQIVSAMLGATVDDGRAA